MRKARLAVVIAATVAPLCALFLVLATAQENPVVAAAPPTPPTGASAAAAAKPMAAVEFGAVKAVLDTACITCHGATKPAGEISLVFKDEAAAKAKAQDDPEFWNAVSRMITTREMPPA